ncbi:hypothetical protein BU25DRAFT_420284 [Macroventuria anomochaeta]|uniref:Uncharacterized protein n=1 Tax=Macroventuria anomochaeta TaxID=301207 RepID=A0ACB6S7V8_9PLEO|nr:uncharacterized protein BU25DRAFT_420284 [Macroventuria anomochaeta]KAF2629444.1 hypothetical protein BU25DRAFT_420284 [Macroventuria anomochaeta]
MAPPPIIYRVARGRLLLSGRDDGTNRMFVGYSKIVTHQERDACVPLWYFWYSTEHAGIMSRLYDGPGQAARLLQTEYPIDLNTTPIEFARVLTKGLKKHARQLGTIQFGPPTMLDQVLKVQLGSIPPDLVDRRSTSNKDAQPSSTPATDVVVCSSATPSQIQPSVNARKSGLRRFYRAEGGKRLNWNKIGLNMNTVSDKLVGFEDNEPAENVKENARFS